MIDQARLDAAVRELMWSYRHNALRGWPLGAWPRWCARVIARYRALVEP